MSVFLQIISVSATAASLCMVASPVLTVNKMRAAKTVGVMTITFFCAQFLNCNVWAMYGVQKNAYPVIICNTIGCAIAAYCILTFLTVARLEERSGRTLKSTTYRESLNAAMLTSILIIVLMLLFLYLMNYVNRSFAAQLNGILGGCCGVFMLSSPLGMAKDIIKNKNAEPLQPPTVIFATLNSVLWTLYGLLTMDMYITIPNTLCTLACFFQIFLLVRYGRHPAERVDVTEALAPVPVD
ncbi:Sugar efflux transporter for intercellular exchange [Novymonas esmeraldas]|uniref:Sugar transporter SWEET1 n=1 Tax=Novymonas esmeraldas TaxID=1808958 RepID=A0AAW0F5J6_9TRYP